jgi:hypothetical protein
MARRVPRRGREEANNPVCSKDFLQFVVCKVLEREGVSFDDTVGSFEDRCWRLFRLFQFLIPAAVIAQGLPVSLYGVGSCKLAKTGSGYKLRHNFSKRILNFVLQRVKVSREMQSRRVALDRFWRALDLFLVQERGLEAPLSADYFELDLD